MFEILMQIVLGLAMFALIGGIAILIIGAFFGMLFDAFVRPWWGR